MKTSGRSGAQNVRARLIVGADGKRSREARTLDVPQYDVYRR